MENRLPQIKMNDMEKIAPKGIVTHLIDPSYRENMELKKYETEQFCDEPFAQFTDMEMIYYFLHQERDIKEEKNRREKTKKEYASTLVSFYKQLHTYEETLKNDVPDYQEGSILKNIRPRHVKEYQKWLSTAPLGRNGQPYKITTIAKKTIILKSFLQFLHKSGYCTHRLQDALLSASIRRDDLPNRDLSYNETQQIIDHYKEHPINYTLLLLLATTGMRVQELATAKWKDLKYENGEYWLHIIGKGRKERDIYLFGYVFEALCTFRKIRGLSTTLSAQDESPLVTTYTNKAYNYTYLSHYVSKLVRRTNLSFLQYHDTNVTAHTFRHFYAIHSLEKGADLFRVQQTLGHESSKTTEIYVDRYLKKKNNASLLWKQDEF
ncbi:tyrosine-type recombinase/integrase [Priestia koreensis]|uniref:Integrase n=1 Tax=Priestia koreensis TaxID=284581 RepID=A0A0M0KN76_9BACI|nr:tyrosine-type recombinase/integrase [Priestia koreensis]KOO40321.1 hypothetical protein AMD01_21465 [Priestia koreensis]